MEKKNKIIIIAISFALVLLFSGLTYAYFTSATSSESGSTIVAKGGQMNVVYDNKSANISVSNIYPREEAWVTKKFQVIGNNTTDLLMFYKVKMVVDNNEFGLDLSYTLTGTNTSNSGALIPNVINSANIGLNDVSFGTGYHIKGENNVHEYTLQIFFKPRNTGDDSSDNQNYGQEANFAAHLVIEIDGTSTTSSPSNWDKVGSNTLLAGIKKNYTRPTATLTNPVTDISASNEAVMSLTPDDYGISYYFRGNVRNNFVSFAGMCWRIVRITGDGSIKMTLYDNASEKCTHSGGLLAFARYNGDTYKTKFNEKFNDNAYIGFMYGTPNSTTYAATHANINKSTILQNLETWYKAKLTAYTDKLADTIWCNDKSTVKNLVSTNFNIDNGELLKDAVVYGGLGYQKEYSVYGPYARNIGFEQGYINTLGTGPSLICPKDNDGGKLSKFTVDDTVNGNGNLDYKIGLLTVDEMALAGLAPYTNSKKKRFDPNSITSYLRNNAINGEYWALSPRGFINIASVAWTSTNLGSLGSGLVHSSYALRPAISLKNDVTISGGNGTVSSPFVVN